MPLSVARLLFRNNLNLNSQEQRRPLIDEIRRKVMISFNQRVFVVSVCLQEAFQYLSADKWCRFDADRCAGLSLSVSLITVDVLMNHLMDQSV